MSDEHAGLFFEVCLEPFGEVNRTMLTAGTADGHREITAIVSDVGRQPVTDEARDVSLHALHFRLVGKEVANSLVPAGLRTQYRVVVWVGQAAHVEDEVGIERNAVLEAEGFEQ